MPWTEESITILIYGVHILVYPIILELFLIDNKTYDIKNPEWVDLAIYRNYRKEEVRTDPVPFGKNRYPGPVKL